jgi:hypothetical protein
MDVPPEDSIFSAPIWKKGFRDPNASRVQMNPALAYSQGETKTRTAPFALAVSMLVVAGVIIAGGVYSVHTVQTSEVRASVNLKNAVFGTVKSVDIPTNTFMLTFGSTQDPDVSSAPAGEWRVQLPPGEGFRMTKGPTAHVCSTVEDIYGDVSQESEQPCADVITPSKSVVVEYVILKKDIRYMVAKKIIVSAK